MTHHLDANPTLRRRAGFATTHVKGLVRPGTAVAALAAVALVLAACSSTPTASTTTAGNSGAATTTGATTATTAASATATVKAASTNKGTVLENSAGMPLYTLGAGTSCTGACAQAWPPLTVPAGTTPKAGAGVTGTLATIMSGGALQVTYNGKALYTFLSDSTGQVTGDGVAGFSVAKVAAASGSGVSSNTSPPTTKASGGGYQY